jgi:moderate conductance mechanosensitive channel
MEIFNIDLEPYLRGALSIGLKLIVLLIAYWIVSPLGKKIIISTITQISKRQKLSEGRTKTLEKLMLNIYTYGLFFILIVTFFSILNIPIAPLLAGAGILGLAIGFGAQGLVSDVVTGFFILLERQIDVDDYVTAAGLDGVVEEVGLKTSKLRGFDGTLHYIPNRNISNVSNHSRGNMRALVDIGIAYDENVEEALTVLQKACEKFSTDERIQDGPNVLGVQTLGTSDVVIRVIAQTTNMEQWAVERDIRKALKQALDEAGIEIPFPHQVYIEKKVQS